MTDISVNTQELAPSPANNPGLNIQDIVQLLNIVDVACRRGAFRAEEMTAVGGSYDKVLAFLKATGAITSEATEQETNNAQGSEQ